MTPPPPLSPVALDEAADWLMRMQSGEADPAALERWRTRSPENTRAWDRAQALLGKLNAVPPTLAMPTLGRPVSQGRRRALARLGKLALLLGVAPAGWMAHRSLHSHGFTADYRSAAGEQRTLVLADGTHLTLNTASAVDVRFDQTSRSIVLRTGEILVKSGPADSSRPLQVITRHGTATPIGTRFTVRQDDAFSHVAVLEGSVRIASASGSATQTLAVGQGARYTAEVIGPLSSADDSTAAWTRGMLLADDMPLAELAAELSRYRKGLIQCDDAIAGLRVSGAFPVSGTAGTDRSLAMLAATHPVEVRSRLGGLWVSLEARR